MRPPSATRSPAFVGYAEDEAVAAIAEYRLFIAANPGDELVPVLRETIEGLAVELRWQQWIAEAVA